MADRPILFNAPMIKALLAGRKTQTRRVLKPQPSAMNGGHPMYDGHGRYAVTNGWRLLPCVGDLLWVRESGFYIEHPNQHDPILKRDIWDIVGWRYAADDVIVGVDGESAPTDYVDDCVQYLCPSIHMPRWASRLTLEVTDVKVERLQEISEKDAVAEGCLGRLGPPDEWDQSPREEFGEVWKESYGVDAWVANPWVAAISFKVHHANIDALARKEAAE